MLINVEKVLKNLFVYIKKNFYICKIMNFVEKNRYESTYYYNSEKY